MTRRFATTVAKAAFCAVIIAAAPQSFAQTHLPQGGAPSSPAKPGQFENKDAPVQIEAATLEVHDKSKTATFSGNVQVVQGDTTMKCRSLVVFYGPEEGPGATKAAAAIRTGAQNIGQIDARGGVTVVTTDPNASGHLGV